MLLGYVLMSSEDAIGSESNPYLTATATAVPVLELVDLLAEMFFCSPSTIAGVMVSILSVSESPARPAPEVGGVVITVDVASGGQFPLSLCPINKGSGWLLENSALTAPASLIPVTQEDLLFGW